LAKRSRKAFLFVVIPVIALGFAGGYWVKHRAVSYAVAKSERQADYEGQQYAALKLGRPSPLDTIFAVFTYLRKNYVDEIGDQTPLTYGTIRGMAAYFNDPGTRFLEPKESTRYHQEASGSFEGIGAVVDVHQRMEPITSPGMKKELARIIADATANGENPTELGFSENAISKSYLTIVAPVPGGPADKAGIQPGDRVEYVDGKWIVSYPAVLDIMEDRTAVRNNRMKRSEYEAKVKVLEAKLKGAYTISKAWEYLQTTDKPVKLRVVRDGAKNLVEVTVNPAKTTVQPVQWEDMGSGVGYVRVTSFGADAPAQFKSALNVLRSKGVKQLIIDLRNNASGESDEMVRMLEDLGVNGIAAKVQKKKGVETTADLKASGTEGSEKVAVVINRGTASLAEVFAAALRDRNGATLIGTRTAGDAMAHESFDLGDGSTLIMTTGKYFTSKGHDFSQAGLLPDVEVAAATTVGSVSSDTAIAKARQALRGEGK